MPVEYRGKTSGNGASPLTFAHTCNAVSNYLFVWATTGFGDSVSSVTYNALPLTKLDSLVSGGRSIFLWGRPNPPVGGAYNVVVTHAAAWGYATACDWSGVRSSNPVVNVVHGYYVGDFGNPMICSVEVASGENAAMEGTGGAYGTDNWENCGSQTTIDSTGSAFSVRLCVGRYAVGKGTKTFKWQPPAAGGVTACYIAVEVNAGAGFLPASLRLLNGSLTFIKKAKAPMLPTVMYASPVTFTHPYAPTAAAGSAEVGARVRLGDGSIPKDGEVIVRTNTETEKVYVKKGVIVPPPKRRIPGRI